MAGNQSQDQKETKPRGNPAWKKGGESPNPAGRGARADVRADATNNTSNAWRGDGWYNLVTGLGTDRDKRGYTNFIAEVIPYEWARQLYRGDDFAAKGVEIWPNEMVREGYEITTVLADDNAPGEASKTISADLAQWWVDVGVLPAMHKTECWRRAFGGGGILLGVNDGQELDQPLNEDGIISFDWLTPLEPRELIPIEYYGDPRAAKFGEPAVYLMAPINVGLSFQNTGGATNGSKGFVAPLTRVHESRIIRLCGPRVSRASLFGVEYGWGDNIFTRVHRVLRDFNVSWSSAATLIAEFAQAVFKIKGLAEIIAEDNKELFSARMQGVNLSRSTINALLIDADEEFKREQTPITGLPDMLDRFATRVAAAFEVPLPVMLGESPGGLNASGASGDQLRMFYDRVATKQALEWVPALTRITSLRAKMISKAGGPAIKSICIKAKPLWQPTEKEQAETRKTNIDATCELLDRSVVSVSEARRSLTGSGNGRLVLDEDEIDFDEPDPGDAAEFKAENGGAPAGTDPSGADIQKQAMNGAQITSLLEVVTSVGTKQISPQSGRAILMLAFQLSAADATAILGPDDFTPDKPDPAPTPFGGGAPVPPGAKPPAPPEPDKPAAPDAPPMPMKPSAPKVP